MTDMATQTLALYCLICELWQGAQTQWIHVILLIFNCYSGELSSTQNIVLWLDLSNIMKNVTRLYF